MTSVKFNFQISFKISLRYFKTIQILVQLYSVVVIISIECTYIILCFSNLLSWLCFNSEGQP
jgi:hypothetical protein